MGGGDEAVRVRVLRPVVDDDGRHEPGEIIELTPNQGVQALLDNGDVEPAPKRRRKKQPAADASAD